MKKQHIDKLIDVSAYIVAILIVVVVFSLVGWVFSFLWNFVFGGLLNLYINAFQGGAVLLMAFIIGSYFRREKV